MLLFCSYSYIFSHHFAYITFLRIKIKPALINKAHLNLYKIQFPYLLQNKRIIHHYKL